MALIKCPECGKSVSSEAVSCIHCGYPLEKNRETLESTPAQVVVPEGNTPEAYKSQKNSKTKLIICVSAVFVCAVLAIVLFVLPSMKKANIKMPYGITADMSLSQAAQILEKNSFVKKENQYLSKEIDFNGRKIFDTMTSGTTLSSYGTSLEIRHQITDESAGKPLKPIYLHIVEEFTKQFGAPTNGYDDIWDNNTGCYVRVLYSNDTIYVIYHCIYGK